MTGLKKPRGFQEVEAPRFHDKLHMEMVRLSALRTGCLYPPGNISGTQFCRRLSQPQGQSAAGRIMSMENSNDTFGNRNHDLPPCNTVPQPTAPPRSPISKYNCLLSLCIKLTSRSKWPRVARRRSAVAHLFRLWVRNSLEAWMSVLRVVCCQVEDSATS